MSSFDVSNASAAVAPPAVFTYNLFPSLSHTSPLAFTLKVLSPIVNVLSGSPFAGASIRALASASLEPIV